MASVNIYFFGTVVAHILLVMLKVKDCFESEQYYTYAIALETPCKIS